MKIYFLGTNGWYDTKTGNTICVLIETDKEYIILDAGNGLYKIDQHVTKNKPIYLFISHTHLDHIIGLHTLNKFSFRQGINLFCPPKTSVYLRTLLSKPYTMPINRLKFSLKLQELDKVKKFPFKIDFKKLLHTVVCYGYRFVCEGKIISYCTDTGLCNNLYTLSNNADLLITECSYTVAKNNKDWPHLNPQDSARVARDSNVGNLRLVHFDANIYDNFKYREKAEKDARKIFKNTKVAYDDMKMEF